jgi:hypothetical protein
MAVLVGARSVGAFDTISRLCIGSSALASPPLLLLGTRNFGALASPLLPAASKLSSFVELATTG